MENYGNQNYARLFEKQKSRKYKNPRIQSIYETFDQLNKKVANLWGYYTVDEGNMAWSSNIEVFYLCHLDHVIISYQNELYIQCKTVFSHNLTDSKTNLSSWVKSLNFKPDWQKFVSCLKKFEKLSSAEKNESLDSSSEVQILNWCTVLNWRLSLTLLLITNLKSPRSIILVKYNSDKIQSKVFQPRISQVLMFHHLLICGGWK